MKSHAAKLDSDDFRSDVLYCEAVDDCFRKHEVDLRELYKKYAEGKFSKSNVPTNLQGKLLGFDDFIKML